MRKILTKGTTTSVTTAMILFTIILVFVTPVIISGCSGYNQTAVTVPTAIESSTVETTLLEIPATESAQEEKTPQNFELLYVPKLVPPQEQGAVPWFDVIKSGLEQCAIDYGFKVTVIGPPKADPAIQAQIVLDNIAKTYDAITVCPIDDGLIDSAFARANKAGVMTFSNEGYTLRNVTFDIEAMSPGDFGEAMMKSGIQYTAGKGSYLISVGFLGSVSQNEWADAEIAYQQENAAGLKNILGYSKNTDRFEDNEDSKIAAEKLTEFINNNKDLNLIIGNSGSTAIAAGETIAKKRLKGKLFYVGTGLPVTIGEYIEDEILQEGFFWDPYMMGYALGYIALQSWLGNNPETGSSVLKPDGTKIEGYESLNVGVNTAGGSLLFGNGIISINKNNLENWYKKFADYGWSQK